MSPNRLTAGKSESFTNSQPQTEGSVCDVNQCKYLHDTDHKEIDEIDPSEIFGFFEIEDFLDNMRDCYLTVRKRADTIQMCKDSWLAAVDDVRPERDSRRSRRREVEAEFTRILAEGHAVARTALEHDLCKDWDNLPLTVTDLDQQNELIQKIDGIKNTRAFEALSDSTEMIISSELIVSYLAELEARINLAKLFINYPYMADLTINPNIMEPSEPLKKIAAADIQRGKDKSVILHFISGSMDQMSLTGSDVAEYLADGDLSREAKLVFFTIGKCMKQNGMDECPLNDYGICQNVFDNIELHEDITKEIYDQRQAKLNHRLNQLIRFANSVGRDPLKLNRNGAVPTKAVKSDSLKRKRGRTDANIAIGSAESDETPETRFPFSRLSIKVSNDDYIEIDLESEAAIDDTIQTIMESELFADYIIEHRTKGIDKFFKRALKNIIFNKTYANDVSIIKSTDPREQNFDGKTGVVHRLSGRELRGGSGGKICRDTRIVFVPIHEGDRRTVIFTNVAQRQEDNRIYGH